MSRSEAKFPLTGDVFLTVTTYNGKPIGHVRKFVTINNVYDQESPKVIPTKIGICLSLQQMKLLLNSLPYAISEFETRMGEEGDLKRSNTTSASPPTAVAGAGGPHPTGPHKNGQPKDRLAVMQPFGCCTDNGPVFGADTPSYSTFTE